MPPKRKVGRPPRKNHEKMADSGIKNKSQYNCEKCTKSFETSIGLRRHKKACEPKTECVKQEKSSIELDYELESEYKKIITGQKLAYVCKKCNKKFKFEESYQKHVALEHSELPNSLKCNKCIARCPTSEDLKEHIRKAHKKEVYRCPHCDKTFTRNYHVIRHIEQMGCNACAEQTDKMFVCEICNCTFTRKDNLMYHLRHHLRDKPYKCKICQFEAITHKKLLIHARDKHLGKKFQCDHCGKITKSRMAIAKHLKIHGHKEFACNMCNYMTHTIEVMQRHVLRHTSDKPFKCPQCPRSFIQQCQLRQHVVSHEGNTCTQCDQTFPTKASLILHLRTHEGLEQLYCTYADCKYSKVPFAYEESLKKHLDSHVGNKSYSCQLCSKKFHVEINLKRHLNIHTLDRPRRCMYCATARAYIRGDMLVRHVRNRHPDIFKEHLTSVRQVLGFDDSESRVRRNEIESIILRLDALEEQVFQKGNLGKDLYGGMTEIIFTPKDKEPEDSPLMSEEELTENLGKLLSQLIDEQTLQYLGWPENSVDEVLEKVIEQCGQRAADRERWSRVQCLRENAKHLFLHVIDDKTIARMLSTHTIDQVVRHILNVSQ